MDQDTSKLITIPIAIFKADFFALYRPMSKRFLTLEINKIIIENRRTHFPAFKDYSDERLVQTQTIHQFEFVAFAKIYGLPDGYCYPKTE